MKATITLLPGDGIGPEVTDEAVKVLRVIEEKFHHSFTLNNALFGGIAIDQTGSPYPQETQDLCNRQMLFYWAQLAALNGVIPELKRGLKKVF